MYAVDIRSNETQGKTPILTGQTICGPVVMLVGGRLTPVRTPRLKQRAPGGERDMPAW